MLKGFRDFLLRGNIIDLAVAVVIGAAFTAMVTALVKDMITPLIAAIFGKPDFSDLTFTINGSEFLYGDFLNALISFVLIAVVVYFLIVVPTNRLMALRKSQEPAGPETHECPQCMSKIPVAARRCAFCTAVVEAAG